MLDFAKNFLRSVGWRMPLNPPLQESAELWLMLSQI
jgi:hypothetical protein